MYVYGYQYRHACLVTIATSYMYVYSAWLFMMSYTYTTSHTVEVVEDTVVDAAKSPFSSDSPLLFNVFWTYLLRTAYTSFFKLSEPDFCIIKTSAVKRGIFITSLYLWKFHRKPVAPPSLFRKPVTPPPPPQTHRWRKLLTTQNTWKEVTN